MWASAAFYLGISVATLGSGLVLKPIRKFRVSTRRRALAIATAGLLLAVVALFLPVVESRASQPTTRLDAIMPVWQFREFHTIRIAAPPVRVLDAVRGVRADEIQGFRTLTWIRRGGRPAPSGILNPGEREPLIDVATRSGFVRLADDGARELVIGTVVVAPPGTRGRLTPEVFQQSLPPGFALAAMNFVVTEDGAGGSRLSTETRVFANSDAARRQFAAYWRVIYPGSAMIRRMWLRAIARRATSATH
jgi:hypothetical protein